VPQVCTDPRSRPRRRLPIHGDREVGRPGRHRRVEHLAQPTTRRVGLVDAGTEANTHRRPHACEPCREETPYCRDEGGRGSHRARQFRSPFWVRTSAGADCAQPLTPHGRDSDHLGVVAPARKRLLGDTAGPAQLTSFERSPFSFSWRTCARADLFSCRTCDILAVHQRSSPPVPAGRAASSRAPGDRWSRRSGQRWLAAADSGKGSAHR